jgi:DNA-binding transcriptional LysR family regulator
VSFTDWTLVQSFAAVVDAGSLAAAARKTGGSQPTMSRHITALEQSLGVRLFDRTGTGLVLTATGVTLYEDAKLMAQAAARIALSAAGQSEAIAGTIRISASETMAAWVLPDILARFHQQEPDIAIELVSSDQTDNLLLREADIALRMFQPTQSELIAKKVGSVKVGMFAAPRYLARKGEIKGFEDFRDHSFISGDINNEILTGFQNLGIPVTRDFFAFRCDSRIVQWQMVLKGFGIGFAQADIADSHPSIVQLFPDIIFAQLPIWLTSHAELRTSRRVRRVYDFLAEELVRKYGNPASS